MLCNLLYTFLNLSHSLKTLLQQNGEVETQSEIAITIATSHNKQLIKCSADSPFLDVPVEKSVALNVEGDAKHKSLKSSRMSMPNSPTVPPGAISLTGYIPGTPLALGSTINLDCSTCNGNPQPLVKWTDMTSGLEVGSSSSSDGNDCTNKTLTLGPLTKNFNNKVYECFAGNGIDPDWRESRTLNVQCKYQSHKQLCC